jgi:Uma2 family endonuclease
MTPPIADYADTMTALTIIPRDSEKALRIPATVSDLASFRRWVRSRHFPEKARASYIAGEIEVDMSAEEAFSHNSPKMSLLLAVGNWVEKYDLGQVFPDGMLVVNEKADIANEPDLMFCRWDTLASGRAELKETKPGSGRSMELVGTPDLVVEIVSKSSVTKDAVTLKERYALAGIPEYWLIDCRRDTIRLDVLTLRGRKYRVVKPNATGTRRSAVLDANVRLTRAKSPVNTWRYKLSIELLSRRASRRQPDVSCRAAPLPSILKCRETFGADHESTSDVGRSARRRGSARRSVASRVDRDSSPQAHRARSGTHRRDH